MGTKTKLLGNRRNKKQKIYQFVSKTNMYLMTDCVTSDNQLQYNFHLNATLTGFLIAIFHLPGNSVRMYPQKKLPSASFT